MDGDYIENDQGPQQEVQAPRTLRQVCEETEEEWQWMEYCLQERIGFQYARWFWNDIHLDTITIRPGEDIEGAICEPLGAYRWNRLQHPVITVVGPAGCGKTTWAKLYAPRPSLFVSHIDQLRLFKPGFHKSIIFDDMNVSHWPRESQIHLLDFENSRAIHLRHVVATIPAGIFKIFTSNHQNWNLQDAAIRRRMYVLNVRENGLIGQ